VLFDAPLDARTFSRALDRALDAGDLDAARALARAGGDAWLARISRAALDAWPEPRAVSASLDEALAELRGEADAGLRPLRMVASLASTLGMLAAILALNHVGVPSGGLLALQAGLVQSLVVAQAVASVAMGGCTAMVVLMARALIRRHTKRLYDEAVRLIASLTAHAEGPEGTSAA
jgi:hypothetical protein